MHQLQLQNLSVTVFFILNFTSALKKNKNSIIFKSFDHKSKIYVVQFLNFKVVIWVNIKHKIYYL